LIYLRKSENDALKVQSLNILNHYWSAHDHCVCCCLQHKSVKLHRIVEILLDWGTALLTATGKPIKIATIEIFDKTHGPRFL